MASITNAVVRSRDKIYTFELKKDGKQGKKEGNVLFNDELNPFCLRFYYVGHYGKGPIRWQERKPAAATWATLSDQQQGFFYMLHPKDGISHTTTFVTQVVEHWLEREIA